jgi:mono/diheme cytochrome c family protein
MADRPFPWLVGFVVALSLLAVLAVGALVTVALQPPAAVSAVPDAPLPPLESRGRAVFRARGCVQCHTVSGEAGIGPTLKDYWGSQRLLADGSTVLADEAHFRQSLREPLSRITQGYRPAMPAFGQSIAESDIVALMAYIKTLQSPASIGAAPPPATAPARGASAGAGDENR